MQRSNNHWISQLRNRCASIHYLNISQLFGAANDNLFRFTVAYLLIDRLGPSNASWVLSTTSLLYILPFLIFSPLAGLLADRYSKKKILVCLKSFEICITLMAIPLFSWQSIWGVYLLLLSLAIHSALFGPAKYALIPELTPPSGILRANGLITSSTYLAIIGGTFLASFLTMISSHQFVWAAILSTCFACIGFISALLLPPTPSGNAPLSPSLFLQTVRNCRNLPGVLPSLLGSSYFLFLGSFVQLNLIPFTIQTLNLNEVAGGYLFILIAIGVASGSYFVSKGKFGKRSLWVSLGASLCASGILILLGNLTTLPTTMLALYLLGCTAGAFLVPLEGHVQLYSSQANRGQTIAIGSFLSFSGVLISSILLYLCTETFNLTPSGCFIFLGCFTGALGFLLFLSFRSFLRRT